MSRIDLVKEWFEFASIDFIQLKGYRSAPMAYTRIHGIKTTLNKALVYIENPEKTDHELLVSGYNVDPLSASIEFEITAALAKVMIGDYTKIGGANNLAYHMIQSFSPYDKLAPEEAHEVGRKWADDILKGQYEYVLTTRDILYSATRYP